jgi:hypothetical protein
MALKIIQATEPLPVTNLIITMYSQPGVGKTSIAQTAEDTLTLDFDKGIYRAFNRKASVTITRWSDVSAMTAEDLAPYKTIVVDTAGRALDVLSQDIIDNNPKMGNFGSLSLQGFGVLKGRFAGWQGFLRSLGKDLILVSHMSEEKKGDDMLERIDAQGSSRNEIYKSSDAMCRIRLDDKDRRFLDFDPRQGGFGKNPAQLPKILVPELKDNPAFLAEVIAKIKSSLNHQTSVQAEAVKSEEQWAGAVAEASTVAEINKLLTLAKERNLGKRDKGLLATKAMTLGLEFSRSDGWFVQKQVA